MTKQGLIQLLEEKITLNKLVKTKNGVEYKIFSLDIPLIGMRTNPTSLNIKITSNNTPPQIKSLELEDLAEYFSIKNNDYINKDIADALLNLLKS